MTGGVLGRSLGVVNRFVAVLLASVVVGAEVAGCGGQSSRHNSYQAAKQPAPPPGITPRIAACQRAGKLVCNPRGVVDKFPLARPDPAGARFLTGQEVLSRYGGLGHLRKGETVEAVRMTYGRLHAVNPALASATRLLVDPSRIMWAITQYFSPPIPYQPCRYDSCPSSAGPPYRTIYLSASSTVIDALTGKATDSCTGCAAIPRPPGGAGTLSGELAVCCNVQGNTPVAGVIDINLIGGESRVIGVNSTGHFSLPLPVGRYQAMGGIPQLGWRVGQCHPVRPTSSAAPASPIDIRLNTSTPALIVCQGQ